MAAVDVSTDALEAAHAELGDALLPISADVRQVDDVRAAVDRASDAFGGLDTVVISAGVIHIKPLADVTERDWDTTLDINLKGAFLTMQAAAPHLVAAGPGRGRIVAISSDAGRRGFSWIAAYTASKFGLVGLVESVAVELAEHGVTVNAVCPVGAPGTGMGRQVLDWKVGATGKAPDEIDGGGGADEPARSQRVRGRRRVSGPAFHQRRGRLPDGRGARRRRRRAPRLPTRGLSPAAIRRSRRGGTWSGA